MYITMIIAYSMTSHTEGLGRKSIEVVLSAGVSPGPIKIESLRDVTLHSKLIGMCKPHLRSIPLRKEWMVSSLVR